jgi:DNA-binding MarR family transcriptional regulator
MRLITAVYKGLKSIRKKEADLINKSEVTFAQFEVLIAVYHFPGLCVNDIIDKTSSSIGNISYLVKNLENEGYLVTSPSDEDKRAKIINLTDKGETFMTKFFPRHLQNIDNTFSVYSDDEKEQLIELLRKLR